MKRSFLYLARLCVSLAIIGGLLIHAQSQGAWDGVAVRPGNGWLLAVAAVLVLVALSGAAIRWHHLARPLHLDFTRAEAVQLTLVGFAVSCVTIGGVGSDVYRGIFLAKQHRERRWQAVATILIDRVVGLYSLFLFAAAAVLLSGISNSPVWQVRAVAWTTWICALVATAGLTALWLLPDEGGFAAFCKRLPLVGRLVRELTGTLRVYRRHTWVLAQAVAMSVGCHLTFVAILACVGHALEGNSPSLETQFVAGPLAAFAGAVPLPFDGLGAFEAALDFLYCQLSSPGTVLAGRGLLVALGYRAVTFSVAGVAALAFLVRRRPARLPLTGPHAPHSTGQIRIEHDRQAVA